MCQLIKVSVQADEKIQLIRFLRHGISAETEPAIAYLSVIVARFRLEGHAGIVQMLHHDLAEDQFRVGLAVGNL